MVPWLRLASSAPLVVLVACSAPAVAPNEAAPQPAPPGAAAPPATSKPEGGPGAEGAAGHLQCGLPAPVKSEDPCKSDADCGPSSPCHAKACVAKAKSQPPGPDTMCTQSMECDTADANRCGCYEGRCALIPPTP